MTYLLLLSFKFCYGSECKCNVGTFIKANKKGASMLKNKEK